MCSAGNNGLKCSQTVVIIGERMLRFKAQIPPLQVLIMYGNIRRIGYNYVHTVTCRLRLSLIP